MKKELFGELFGTFILVFIGLSSIVAAEFIGWLNALWQVALIWGLGVTIAIYATRHFSHSHLNPAISLAFLMVGEIDKKRFAAYMAAQLLGAVFAGILVLLVFQSDILTFELENGIVRGESGSIRSAMAFGEFYPNPAFADEVKVGHITAIWSETFGTFLLAMVILLLYRVMEIRRVFPVFVGMTVSAIILLIAPYTQAGLNPARDFGPRLVAYFAGWGEHALPTPAIGMITVYILGPCAGALFAVFTAKKFTKGSEV